VLLGGAGGAIAGPATSGVATGTGGKLAFDMASSHLDRTVVKAIIDNELIQAATNESALYRSLAAGLTSNQPTDWIKQRLASLLKRLGQANSESSASDISILIVTCNDQGCQPGPPSGEASVAGASSSE
jgi:hypothetical protein